MSVGELTRAVPGNGPFSIVNCGWGERLHSGQFISQVSSFVRLYPHCTQAGRKAGQRYRFQYVFAGEYIFCLKPGGDWLALYYRLHIFKERNGGSIVPACQSCTSLADRWQVYGNSEATPLLIAEKRSDPKSVVYREVIWKQTEPAQRYP